MINPGGTSKYYDPISMLCYDPPIAAGYELVAQDDGRFASVDGFPTGFGDSFFVKVGPDLPGHFTPVRPAIFFPNIRVA